MKFILTLDGLGEEHRMDLSLQLSGRVAVRGAPRQTVELGLDLSRVR
jgi:hypothetical protein